MGFAMVSASAIIFLSVHGKNEELGGRDLRLFLLQRPADHEVHPGTATDAFALGCLIDSFEGIRVKADEDRGFPLPFGRFMLCPGNEIFSGFLCGDTGLMSIRFLGDSHCQSLRYRIGIQQGEKRVKFQKRFGVFGEVLDHTPSRRSGIGKDFPTTNHYGEAFDPRHVF
jgi:hypothetical protein